LSQTIESLFLHFFQSDYFARWVIACPYTLKKKIEFFHLELLRFKSHLSILFNFIFEQESYRLIIDAPTSIDPFLYVQQKIRENLSDFASAIFFTS